MTAIERLQGLASEQLKEKYPNVPTKAIPPPKYTDRTANGLTRCIVHWINLNGYQAERISSTGRPLDSRKRVTDVLGNTMTIGSISWIPGQSQNGTADISATIKGRSVKIEVKIGRDRQSQDQKKYQKSIERAGGIYIIARTFQGFLDWWDKMLRYEG